MALCIQIFFAREWFLMPMVSAFFDEFPKIEAISNRRKLAAIFFEILWLRPFLMLIIRNYCIQLFLLVHFQVFCVKGADQVLMIALPEGILMVYSAWLVWSTRKTLKLSILLTFFILVCSSPTAVTGLVEFLSFPFFIFRIILTTFLLILFFSNGFLETTFFFKIAKIYEVFSFLINQNFN